MLEYTLMLWDPFPQGTGISVLCVMVDAFTWYTHTYAMVDKSAISVARALCSFIMKFSCPRTLISDNGREVINEVIKDLTKMLNVDLFTIASYWPSANGLVESHSRAVTNILKYLVADSPNE